MLSVKPVHLFRNIVSVALVLLVTACSSKNALEPTPLTDIDVIQADIETLWSKDLGSNFSDNINHITIATSQNMLFAVNGGGSVYAINSQTGDVAWKSNVADDVTGGVGSGYGTLAVVTEKGLLVALSSKTGEQLWQYNLQAESYAAPVVDAERVYVQTVDNQIFAIDRISGKRVWHYTQYMPLISLWGSSQPRLFNNWLIAGLANGKLVAINKSNGQEEWERQVGVAKGTSDLEQLLDIDSQFIVKDGMLWAASYQENIIGMNLLDGSLQWYQQISSFTDLAFNQGQIIVADNQSVVHGLSAYSGDTFWTLEALKGRKVHSLASVDDYILATDYEGYLHIIDNQSGEIVSRKKLRGKGLAGAPIVIDGKAYLLTRNAKLLALAVASLVDDAEALSPDTLLSNPTSLFETPSNLLSAPNQ